MVIELHGTQHHVVTADAAPHQHITEGRVQLKVEIFRKTAGLVEFVQVIAVALLRPVGWDGSKLYLVAVRVGARDVGAHTGTVFDVSYKFVGRCLTATHDETMQRGAQRIVVARIDHLVVAFRIQAVAVRVAALSQGVHPGALVNLQRVAIDQFVVGASPHLDAVEVDARGVEDIGEGDADGSHGRTRQSESQHFAGRGIVHLGAILVGDGGNGTGGSGQRECQSVVTQTDIEAVAVHPTLGDIDASVRVVQCRRFGQREVPRQCDILGAVVQPFVIGR